MRASSTVLLIGLIGFSVSCAHKNQQQAEIPHAPKVEKKIEKKAEKKIAENKAYTCLVKKDKRTVTLDRKQKRCEVKYTKFGDIQEVAWAESTPSICDQAFTNIRSNIEGAGYKCQDGLEWKQDKKKEQAKQRETATAEKTKTK